MGKIGIETPVEIEPKPQPKRKKPTGLPMPAMPGQSLPGQANQEE
jgi:hypothetical protein